jgi:hypothetical protein
MFLAQDLLQALERPHPIGEPPLRSLSMQLDQSTDDHGLVGPGDGDHLLRGHSQVVERLDCGNEGIAGRSFSGQRAIGEANEPRPIRAHRVDVRATLLVVSAQLQAPLTTRCPAAVGDAADHTAVSNLGMTPQP